MPHHPDQGVNTFNKSVKLLNEIDDPRINANLVMQQPATLRCLQWQRQQEGSQLPTTLVKLLNQLGDLRPILENPDFIQYIQAEAPFLDANQPNLVNYIFDRIARNSILASSFNRSYLERINDELNRSNKSSYQVPYYLMTPFADCHVLRLMSHHSEVNDKWIPKMLARKDVLRQAADDALFRLINHPSMHHLLKSRLIAYPSFARRLFTAYARHGEK